MSLSSWAESVLFGTTLADKLSPAIGELDRRIAIDAPSAPGRPVGLGIHAERARVPFPESLEDPLARGRALHFFANHELLAIELMALAFLRFPDAPPEFRLGVVRTLGEEQAHLRAYLARMSALGVELGQQPLGGFFWRVMQKMESPLEYVAAMSLTFEQANLDFTRSFADRFTEAGDLDSAKILIAIHDDEIRHVGHGVKWFSALGGGPLDFDRYQRVLPRPMTARRAKGIGFDRPGRLAAGLAPAFVDAVARYQESRSPRPKAWVFIPGVEDDLAGRPQKAISLALAADLAPLLMFVAGPSDLVLLPRRPSEAHLDALRRAGIALPELTESLTGRPLGELSAFGGGPALEALAAKLDLDRLAPSIPPRLYDKRWGAAVLADYEPASPVAQLPGWARPFGVADLEALEVARKHLSNAGVSTMIVKSPLSSSGRHRLRLPTTGAIDPPTTTRLSRLLADRPLRAEAWLDAVADLSVQLEVGAADPVRSFGRFHTDGQGRYLGHFLGPARASLAPDILKCVDFSSIEAEADRVGRYVAKRLQAEGHRGPAGVDLLLYRRADGLALHPLLEINPRLTMGHLALALRRLIKPGLHAHFRLVPAEEARALSLPDLVLHEKTGRIESGGLWLTDPAGASITAAHLLVAGA